LTRSTFTGQQRNATTTRSGDIGASWDIYRKQISAGTNHSMSGIPYWTFDIGAFVLGAYGGVFMNGGKDPAYQELYTRMFQLGAFSPIFRSHGSETPREIWEMGEFVTPLIKIGNLRYRLMPYIYSLAWKITNDDYTIMRGLPMDFPADKNTYNIDDQFMFGPSILVSPVTEFMYHNPPRQSILIEGNHFKNKKDNPGLDAKYYFDADRKNLSRESIDEKINLFWYTGRPEYATDSTFAVTWEGKLIPGETGKHQFHLLSYDPKRIFINGKQLEIVYKSVEEYLEPIDLEVGKEYDFKLELENKSTGAAKMQLRWKTPSIFAEEQETVRKDKLRKLYLPAGCNWYNFWTGE
ncbi:MAG: glycoside hydrolase family 31 protein, partial [Ignavibacteria bacterium]|nr:glycoside hydrolase family 31 protein [Ignavibacteria bacterium]